MSAASPGFAATPSAKRQGELVHMVRQDCGACHGMTLKGGLGLALTPQALRGRDETALALTILGGRPGTPMPPFRGIVTDDEALWISLQLIAGFPEEH